MSAHCSTCGAAIFWCKTVAGKAIPIDLEPSLLNGNVLITIGDDGARLARVVTVGAGTHVSHFATCPQANQHRREK